MATLRSSGGVEMSMTEQEIASLRLANEALRIDNEALKDERRRKLEEWERRVDEQLQRSENDLIGLKSEHKQCSSRLTEVLTLIKDDMRDLKVAVCGPKGHEEQGINMRLLAVEKAVAEDKDRRTWAMRVAIGAALAAVCALFKDVVWKKLFGA